MTPQVRVALMFCKLVVKQLMSISSLSHGPTVCDVEVVRHQRIEEEPNLRYNKDMSPTIGDQW